MATRVYLTENTQSDNNGCHGNKCVIQSLIPTYYNVDAGTW